MKTQFPAKYLKTEDLTEDKVQLLSSYPNDYGNGVGYYNPVPNLGANISMKSFDYVNAPKAWGFFPGNTSKGNVTIGISDGMVNTSNLDLPPNKVNYLYQNLFNPNFYCGSDSAHGTSVAAIAAADGDNEHGIAGVCYDCKVLNIPYQVDRWPVPNFPGLMEMAQMGVRVINMSWIQGYHDYDLTYTTGYHQTQQDAINQLFDMGVVLVAGAGNEGSYQTYLAPNYQRYGYPASYDHVISVTLVNAKNPNITDEISGYDSVYGHHAREIEDIISPIGGIGFDLTNPNPVFTPFISWATTTNSRVDICGPGYAPSYARLLLGCLDVNGNPAIYASATSSATPFVSGTVALMQSLNPCILTSEVEDVLQLSSKNLEIKPENVNFIGRSGSGKLETGDAVEFTHEMMSPTGVALVDGQDFWRFDFDLRHIFNGLVISNQILRDQNTTNFTARNYIDVTQNADFRPDSLGFVDLNIDSNLAVCVESLKTICTTIERNDPLKISKAKLYPNPNKGSFSILLNRNKVKDVAVTVLDIYGKTIYFAKVNQNEFELNIPNLPTGIYFVKLSSNEINETLKFVKE